MKLNQASTFLVVTLLIAPILNASDSNNFLGLNWGDIINTSTSVDNDKYLCLTQNQHTAWGLMKGAATLDTDKAMAAAKIKSMMELGRKTEAEAQQAQQEIFALALVMNHLQERRQLDPLPGTQPLTLKGQDLTGIGDATQIGVFLMKNSTAVENTRDWLDAMRQDDTHASGSFESAATNTTPNQSNTALCSEFCKLRDQEKEEAYTAAKNLAADRKAKAAAQAASSSTSATTSSPSASSSTNS